MLSATFVFSLRVDPISVKNFVVLLQFSLLKFVYDFLFFEEVQRHLQLIIIPVLSLKTRVL